MNPDTVLAVLPNSKEEISPYTDRIRTEQKLARILRALIKWGWVARDQRQSDEGQKFWHNAYWKTELAGQTGI